MREAHPPPDRQQELYWRLLMQLKTDALYFRRRRDAADTKLQGLAVLRAVASSGSIAGWALWHDAAPVWAGIIALAQVADALKDALPFASAHKAAGQYALLLESILVDALFEWEEIASGKVPREDIAARRHRLMRLQHEAECKCFPNGQPHRSRLFAIAEQEAYDYFNAMYGRDRSDARDR